MAFVLAFATATITALAVITYDLHTTRHPLTGDPR